MNSPRIRRYTTIVLLIMQALIPAMKIAALLFGWQLTVVNGLVFAVPMALAAIVTAVVCFADRESSVSRLETACIGFALPLSLLNFLMLPFMQSVAMFIIAVINCLGCLVAFLRNRLRAFIGVTAIVLTVIAVGWIILKVLFHDFGVNEVVRSVPSPDSTYTANVINVDQGALGGDGVVRVQRMKLMGMPLKDVVVLDRRVWLGDWGTAHLIGLHWVDDDTLMIQGKEYDFH